ncbi:thiol:disulfide interchange protein DsbD [Lysobacter niabensis]|uniref:Thiol:disulfide interchange protein DsbD n=1 Tax=Agrilutibacter niabensis TaxID=380628 RepID=A0ABU1VT70_9GAMM|nr:protein-disulfide reductase DsbD domain-containing protein [Lysobacter niabensis]MDR7100677.1 thiol:disulfide interchange protein DsbD [Lysobacter niabensis]
MSFPASRMSRAFLALAGQLLVCTALLWTGAAPALAAAPSCNDENNLLPVEQAFVLEAQATSADRIALRWKIAPGCYLYRHQIRVQSDAGFTAQAPQIPAGEPHQDEYFGRVETYRNALTVNLPGEAHGASTTLKVRYQGCADAGICYPPQTRTLTVALPVAAAADEPVVAFGSNAARGSGVPLSGGLLGNAGAGAVDAAPLPPEDAFRFEAIVGDGNALLLRFTPARDYYLYRDKTSFKLDAAAAKAGIAAGRPKWPRGTAHHDEHFGDVIVFFDQIDVPLPLQRTRTDAAKLTLTTTFQGCQTDGICYPPMTRSVTLDVPAGTITPVANPSDTALTETAATGAVPANAASATTTAQADDAAAGAQPRAASSTAAVPGVLPRGGNLNLFSALALALLGGLILNLMPCVLPVLSLKALSLAGNGEDPARARRHALWYTAGVVLSFILLGGLALALRQAGLALGWGFQLQQPLVVALLALLMFGLGLSMSGVWHVGGRWTGAGHALTTRSGPLGDFFTGVLAVVVATPCTAPFMGAALAWAFTAPPLIALLVFLVLGLGLALPFLLIGFVPALAHRLPRPGAWMETFKQALAFPLYLTAAWLAWVLTRQRGADAIGWWLFAAVLLAFAAWAWTRARTTGHRWAMVAAVLAAVALAWPLRVIHTMPRPDATATLAAPSEGITPVPFSEQHLADLRTAGRVVFVNMTADWCVTCKANERAVFRSDGFRNAMSAANAVYMVGDWTDVDPALTAFLQRYRAVGVPLYVVFPRNGGEGQVLPVVLTGDGVRAALTDAAR